MDYMKISYKKMFIFVVQTLQYKWNKICMKQLAGGKHMENDCFPRTLKFKMWHLVSKWGVKADPWE